MIDPDDEQYFEFGVGFLMSRLETYFGNDWNPWSAQGPCDTPDDFYALIEQAEPVAHRFNPDQNGVFRDHEWTLLDHAGRIRHLMLDPEALEHPIEIDCKCDGGFIYSEPVILDGWHRYIAHRILGRCRIMVSFGGRIDLAEYLSGATDTIEE